MQTDAVKNRQVLRESIQWLMLHYKLLAVIGLCYLGVDKIIEDLPFNNTDHINMVHLLRDFSFKVFTLDMIENMLTIFLIYILVTGIMMTLNQRPLTVNAISISLERKRRELFRITFVVALVITILSMVLESIIYWLDAPLWLSGFVIIFASSTFAIFFIFSPHEMLYNDRKTFESILTSFRIGRRHYFQLISLMIFIGLLHTMVEVALDYFLEPGNYFSRVISAVNGFGLIIVISGVVTIFYHEVLKNNESVK